MFGIGMPEMILILAVALIVIGPKKLPGLAKSLGKAMGEFKKATSDLKDSMQIDTELKDLKTTFNDLEKEDKKTAKTDSGVTEEKPVGNAEPVRTTDNGSQQDSTDDPLDSVQTAFGRRTTDEGDTDATEPVGRDEIVESTEGNSEQGGNGDSETRKDV